MELYRAKWLGLFIYFFIKIQTGHLAAASESGKWDNSAPEAGNLASPLCTPPSSPRGEKSQAANQAGSSHSLTSISRPSEGGPV